MRDLLGVCVDMQLTREVVRLPRLMSGGFVHWQLLTVGVDADGRTAESVVPGAKHGGGGSCAWLAHPGQVELRQGFAQGRPHLVQQIGRLTATAHAGDRRLIRLPRGHG